MVVENTSAGFEAAVSGARAGGWRVVEGFGADGGLRRPTVRAGSVADEGDAAQVVLAAVRGHGVIVFSSASRAVTDRLLDDLGRLGAVTHVAQEDEVEAPLLTAEERALLALLSEGLSLGEAAQRLHISRRTADRRLASARHSLRVTSTSEALLEAGLPAVPADTGGAR